VHHPFGRLGEPWVSSRLVCVLICVEHHENVHMPRPSTSAHAVRDLLRLLACNRLRGWIHHELPRRNQDLGPYTGAEGLRSYFDYLVNNAEINRLLPPGFTGVTNVAAT